MIALARHLPRLASQLPWVPLGDWPTPLEPFELAGRTVWVKREGASSRRYGGNKVRTLELWFGHARAAGARRLWAIGAYGSNHAIATILHAPPWLEVGTILFPQPASPWAIENCSSLLAVGGPLVRARCVVGMPLHALRLAWLDRDAVVMPPGGATTMGSFGAASAAFELAEQLAAGLAPPPRRIVLAVGSTCTSAGLLAGLFLARAAGVWRWPLPIVHGVRVTPWPVTSRLRIARLAHGTLRHAERLGGPPVTAGLRDLLAHLVVDGAELGPGYGRITPRAREAMEVWPAGAPRLDGVYSGKAAAALLRLHRAGIGPLVFWASKSEVVLPAASLEALRSAPAPIVRWLRRG